MIYHELFDCNLSKEKIEKLEISNSKDLKYYPILGEY